jgi:TPR repeat protein
VIDALGQRAESGDAEAIMALGDAYATGEGVVQDRREAFRQFSRAAALGHAPALFKVGSMIENGEGTSVDLPNAFRAYVKAAELGFPPAQSKVADMFATGVGTTQNEALAADWYHKAAVNGRAEAQYNLAVAYEQGRGLVRDREQAQKWYREAANAGYVRAQFNLALMLESELGPTANAAAAAELYRNAAERGFAPAQNNYGLLLAEGRDSVAIDLVEALAWLTIAVENGANPSGRNLVSRKVTPEQLAASQERATQLRSRLAESGFATSVVTSAPPPIPTIEHAPSPDERDDSASRQADSSAERKSDGSLAIRAAWGQEVSALKAEIISLSAEVKDLSVLNDNLRAEQARLTQENLRLATALRAAEAAASAAPPIAATLLPEWTKEKSALEAKIQELMTQLDDAAKRIVEFEAKDKLTQHTEARNLAQASQNTELVARVQALTEEKDNALEEQAQLSKKVSELVAAAEAASKSPTAVFPAAWLQEREGLRVEAQLLKDRLTDAERHIAQLKLAEEVASKEALAAKTDAERIQEELKKTDAQSSRIRDLEHSVDRLTTENAALQQQVQSSATFGAENTRLSDLNAALMAAQQRATELESSAAQGANVMRELSGLRAENARLRNMAQSQHAELRNRVAALQHENMMSEDRLRQAQLTMQQIAASARVVNDIQEIRVPISPPNVAARGGASSGGPRFHTVLPGESLIRISVRYYGTGVRWQEIYHANRDALRGQTKIRVGQRLRVP